MARRLFKANANLALEKEYLRESQERLAMFIQHSPICIYLKEVAERESRVLFASDNFVDMIGITGSEMIGKTMAELFPPEFADKITRDDWAVVSGNQVLTLDEEFNGRPYTSIKFPISQQNRKLLGGYTLEVTEKKLAVEKIEALLDDKEELLKEVHHRIKNNMYAIKNLLAIQASSVSEIAGRANLLEAASRVQSMMMLYDHLLQSSDYLSVSTRAFLSSLAEAVVADFAGDVPVALEMEIADCLLCSGKTQPLGLILNELLTNSMKHAFVGRSRGKVTVTFHVNDGRGMLAVMDDGTGLPDSINFESAPSLGLRLIHLLTKQIGGTVRSELGNGIRVIVEFSI